LGRDYLRKITKCLAGFLSLQRSANEAKRQYISNYATDSADEYGERQEQCRYRRQRSELREHAQHGSAPFLHVTDCRRS
jgi:hypothetical protein